MDEEMLIQRTAEGDTRAFATLVERYQRRVVCFAERILGDTDAAQDIAQEAFLRLWHALSRGLVQRDLSAYLLRIARNLCNDYLRSRHPTGQLDETNDIQSPTKDGPAAATQANALAEIVRRSVQVLPETQREVFVLSHYEGLSYQEIAQVIGCPIGTVASRKYQAVETLRRRLKPWIEPEGEPDK